MDQWRHGRTGWAPWDRSVGAAREIWARLHGVPAADVAVAGQASAFVGLVAQSLERGARVLCAEEDFTSVLWPFQVAAGLEVSAVPMTELAAAIDGSVAVVAFSAVQSSDGRMADLDAIAAAAAHHGALTLRRRHPGQRLAAARASSLRLRVAERATSGCSARAAPRSSRSGPRPPSGPAAGGGLVRGRRPVRDSTTGRRCGWPATPAASTSRRRGCSWVGGVPALEVLEQVGIETIRTHDVALANRLRAGLGLEPATRRSSRSSSARRPRRACATRA